MSDMSNEENQAGGRTAEVGMTRRAVLAAGGAVALGALAGCTAVNDLLDRGSDQLVGTRVSSPAAFYPGRTSSDTSASRVSATSASHTSMQADSAEMQVFRTGPVEITNVPATVRADSRDIDLEGWSTSGPTKAKDLNSSRSNKPRTEWWSGPDDDSDGDGLPEIEMLAGIQDIELDLLSDVATAIEAVNRQDQATASAALDAFLSVTEEALGPELDACEMDVCETIADNSEARKQGVQAARDDVDAGNWEAAASALADVEVVVLGDIEHLDDELEARGSSRPRFSDIVAYLRDEPTIGERFTVCLPDATLPGDRGSLAEQLTLDRVLGYFAASHEPDGKRAPFRQQYGTRGISYDDDGCLQFDGPVSLHEDLACGNVVSAKLDTYTTENRAMVGFSTDGGAVVGGAPASADTDGKAVLVAAGTDVTGEIILGEDRDMMMPGSSSGVSVSPTLVCPVTVTPEDCSCPLPGLFFVRRIDHDDQVIFAGGWVLDEGALYRGSATLLFDEGPTEVASVTREDVESDNYDDRIVEQFSRDRSQHGSAVGSAQVQGTDMNKAELIEAMAPEAFQSDEGRKGLNAVNVKVVGEQGSGGDGDDGSDNPIQLTAMALDAPLVHLAGAGELSTAEKQETNLVPAVNNQSSR